MFLFSLANLILPLFYPTLVYIAAHAYLLLARQKRERSQQHSLKQLLEQQAHKKETELDAAKSALETLQTELTSRQADSEQNRILAEERQRAILQLESELRNRIDQPAGGFGAESYIGGGTPARHSAIGKRTARSERLHTT
jgi:hypothetical protein